MDQTYSLENLDMNFRIPFQQRIIKSLEMVLFSA